MDKEKSAKEMLARIRGDIEDMRFLFEELYPAEIIQQYLDYSYRCLRRNLNSIEKAISK